MKIIAAGKAPCLFAKYAHSWDAYLKKVLKFRIIKIGLRYDKKNWIAQVPSIQINFGVKICLMSILPFRV